MRVWSSFGSTFILFGISTSGCLWNVCWILKSVDDAHLKKPPRDAPCARRSSPPVSPSAAYRSCESDGSWVDVKKADGQLHRDTLPAHLGCPNNTAKSREGREAEVVDAADRCWRMKLVKPRWRRGWGVRAVTDGKRRDRKLDMRLRLDGLSAKVCNRLRRRSLNKYVCTVCNLHTVLRKSCRQAWRLLQSENAFKDGGVWLAPNWFCSRTTIPNVQPARH